MREEPDSFRRYGDAIAWLEWDVHCCSIKKVETLCPGSGHAKALLTFLKSLADKHQFLITGNPTAYPPAFSDIGERRLGQNELEEWYERNGFEILRRDGGWRFLCYPRRTIVSLEESIPGSPT